MRGRCTLPWFIKLCQERAQYSFLPSCCNFPMWLAWLNLLIIKLVLPRPDGWRHPKGMPWQDGDCPEFAIWYRTLDIESFSYPLFTSAMKVERKCSVMSVMCLEQELPNKPFISWVSHFMINHFSSGLNSFFIELGNIRRFLMIDLCASFLGMR